ncbi:MAG: hypothetical protein ABI810_00940 [Sphingomonas bacterium]
MKMLVALALSAFAALGPVPATAEPDQKRDQQRTFDDMRNGRILIPRDIEARVIPSMRGAQYLGFDFDSESGIYTLKFLRNGNVIWVEVDGRSGRVLGRTGN